MKKIMIIGAGEAQLNLINMANGLGYSTVVCDMREGTEAERLADRYYRIDYRKKEEVLKAAIAEKIDGVISNSEPAMLTVAFVSEKMGLPGNSVKSVETLLSKAKFRDLQKELGLYSPQHFVVSGAEELLEKASVMKYPVIVKPVQCSGTRGTARVDSFDESSLRNSFEECRSFSRNGLVAVEEYMEMSSRRVNDVEVFVCGGGRFLWDGWLWQDRSADAPMLPMTEIFPMAMPNVVKQEIKSAVEKLLNGAGITHGEYNVETFYNPQGELFIIEINPRQAGNHIPKLIKEHTGVDLTKLLVTTSVNDMKYYESLGSYTRENNFITLQIVFSKEDGIFDSLFISPEIETYVQWKTVAAREGDKVSRGMNAADAVAYVDLKFDSYETQHRYTGDMERYIYPILKKR